MGRFADLFQRTLEVQGSFAVDDKDLVVPVYRLNEPSIADFIHRGDLLAHAQNGVGAVAGQFSKARFTNPSGSGVLVFVRSLTVRSATGGFHIALAGEPAGGVNRFGFFADTRRVPVTSRCFVNGQAGVAQDVTAVLAHYRGVGSTTAETIVPFACVLLPAWSLYVEGAVVNQDLFVNVQYVERVANPDEMRDRT